MDSVKCESLVLELHKWLKIHGALLLEFPEETCCFAKNFELLLGSFSQSTQKVLAALFKVVLGDQGPFQGAQKHG
jgi:hypothetical protein